MGLWRCRNQRCSTAGPAERPSFEFEADAPTCPKCGVDKRQPDGLHVIAAVAVIHYDPPHERVDGRGRNTLACQPKRPVMGLHATGETARVNCPRCRDTDVYKANLPGPEEAAAPARPKKDDDCHCHG